MTLILSQRHIRDCRQSHYLYHIGQVPLCKALWSEAQRLGVDIIFMSMGNGLGELFPTAHQRNQAPCQALGGGDDFTATLLNSMSACEFGYSVTLPSLSLSFLEDAHQTNCRIRQEITLHFIMG